MREAYACSGSSLGRAVVRNIFCKLSINIMEKEVLETVLKRNVREDNIAKVLEVTQEPALNKGENYMSDIIRVRAKLVLGNGRIVKRSFIIKNDLPNSSMNAVAKDYAIFKVEATLYSTIMKEMEYLMEEYEDTEGVMWCKLYDHGPTFLMFEDLKASGFELADRKTGLNLEEGQYVLHNLARFHAMAKVLEVRGIVTKDMFKPLVILNDKSFIKGIVHSGMATCSKAIKEAWGPSWAKVGEKINIPLETLIEKFKELGQLDEGKFNVLNHGDVWPNNFLFKYDWKNKVPVAFRLLDYQWCHYNTCCLDLTFFLFYSIVPSVRRDNLPALIQSYHDSLTKALDKFGYTGQKPTLEELTTHLDKMFFMGYCLFCSEYPSLVTDLSDGYELGDVMSNDGESTGYSIDVYKDKRLIEKIGPDLVRFVEKYLD